MAAALGIWEDHFIGIVIRSLPTYTSSQNSIGDYKSAASRMCTAIAAIQVASIPLGVLQRALIQLGTVAETGMGKGQKTVGPYLEGAIRGMVHVFCNSVEDAAKTQVYLAASREIREKNVHGEYWVPTWTWTQAYNGSKKQNLTALGKNEEEQRKLWDVSEEAMKKAAASDQK